MNDNQLIEKVTNRRTAHIRRFGVKPKTVTLGVLECQVLDDIMKEMPTEASPLQDRFMGMALIKSSNYSEVKVA